MKKAFLLTVVTVILLASTDIKQEDNGKSNDLIAEDLWGEKINFSQTIADEKPTVIVPFSSSNCGYCMLDGYFAEENYIKTNEAFGGSSFHMCLFNPQLDIYAFQKHYKWQSKILTYPPKMNEFHETGFPSVLAFRNGKQVIHDFYNYSKFDTLNNILWNGEMKITLTSDIKMASAICYENETTAAVLVFPKGMKIPEETIDMGLEWDSYICKNIDSLSPEDLSKHLVFNSNYSYYEIAELFKNKDMPVKFENEKILIGNYSFDYSRTGISFICPNPFNPEKYLSMTIWNGNRIYRYIHYLDYIVFQSENGKSTGLLYGHFDKSKKNKWEFSEERSFSGTDKIELCGKQCAVPQKKNFKENNTGEIGHSFEENEYGTLFTLGNKNCKFPSMVADKSGNIWTTWEENGDINLSCINADNNKISFYKIESNASDSYNPKLAFSDEKVWVFYLNDKKHYYRLYAKTFDGLRVSDEIQISPSEPNDIVLPAVCSDKNGEITIVWSDWIANYRLLKTCKINNGAISGISDIKTCPPTYISDYTNAWYASICYDNTCQVWGAWNQHYPAIMGVYGGKLSDTAQTITQPSKLMDDRENGGYPCIFTDGSKIYTVWESDGWDVTDDIRQKIKFSFFDDKTGKWSIGEQISLDEQTLLCQTPSGLVDKNGTLWVAYSGRPEGKNSVWGIYLSYKKQNSRWSKPVLISKINIHARHPEIKSDSNGNLWVSWHIGSGKNMKINVLKLKNKSIENY